MFDQKEILKNGDASDGLNHWTILENSGDGWTVESGPGESNPAIPGNTNFVTSYGWSKKSQLINLIAEGGFTSEYLDKSPEIQINDWVCARSDCPSEYYLLIELRDGNQNVIKKFRSGTLKAPLEAGWKYPWTRILRIFSNYGPGVRYVYFEHGGKDQKNWAGHYGSKMTGASVLVQTVLEQPTPELIKNGDGINGLNDWTIIENGGNGWKTENGPGQECPKSHGATNFVTSYGWCKKSQLIDLVSAGYTDEDLERQPSITVKDWMCARSDCPSQYYLIVQLRNKNQQVLTQFETGILNAPLVGGWIYPFQSIIHNFVDYGPGVRYVYFEHGGKDQKNWAGHYGSKMTGASVKIQPDPVHSILTPSVELQKRNLLALPDHVTKVEDTTVVPYKWICHLEMKFGLDNYVGSGWITPTTNNYYLVVTAAHCVFDKKAGWAKEITIYPARDGNKKPYQSYTAKGYEIQGARKYLGDQLAKRYIDYFSDNIYDYGAIVVPKNKVNWDNDGINFKVSTDQELNNLELTVTGYPGSKDATMWKAPDKVSQYTATGIFRPDSTEGGVSGSPAYDKNNTAVGILVQGRPGIILANNDLSTRITNEVKQDIDSWKNPLTPNTKITKLELLIHTGDDFGAGTNDTISVTIAGKDYGNLDNPLLKNRSENDMIDAYDLTNKMNQLYPGGMYVRDLDQKQYTITRHLNWSTLGWTSWFYGDWEIHSVMFYVNGHKYFVDILDLWLKSLDPKSSMSVTRPINRKLN